MGGGNRGHVCTTKQDHLAFMFRSLFHSPLLSSAPRSGGGLLCVLLFSPSVLGRMSCFHLLRDTYGGLEDIWNREVLADYDHTDHCKHEIIITSN